MDDWVDRLGGTLLDASVAVALLTSLVTMAMLGCRQPARRLVLGRAATVGALLILPLAWLGPLPRFELVRAVRDSDLMAHPFFFENRTPAPAPHPGDSAIPPTVNAPGRHARTIKLVYLSGVACGLGWLLFGYWGLGWLTRRSFEPSPEAIALYDSLIPPERRHRPQLRVAGRVRRPALLGLFRQSVLIPDDLDRPEALEQLRLSLLHELAHWERRDPWFGLASGLAQAFWFFLPPVWWIRAQMRLDQEFLADRRASHGFETPSVYASSLLALARPDGGSGDAETAPLPPARADASPLFLRVLMLVQCPFVVETRPPLWWCWAASIAVLLGALAVSTVSMRGHHDPSSPPPAGAAAVPRPRTFRMKRLSILPNASTSRGQVRVVELPIRLAERFVLSIEVWGDLASLRQTRVVGHRLSPPASALESLPLAPPAWHHVQIRRDAGGVSLAIDGQPVPIDPSFTTTVWLSVEPPSGQEGTFRDLVLTW